MYMVFIDLKNVYDSFFLDICVDVLQDGDRELWEMWRKKLSYISRLWLNLIT